MSKKQKQYYFLCRFCGKRKRQPEDENYQHYGVCQECAEERYGEASEKFEGANDSHTTQH
jgi:hypothetical protein